MKKKTKILITLMLFVLVATSLTLSCFATEESSPAPAEGGNVFAELYAFFEANADKVFAILAFIGTLILSFAYKKGLFPFVKKALASISLAVKSLGEEAKKNETALGDFSKALALQLEKSEAAINDALTRLEGLEAELLKSAQYAERAEQFRAVLSAEVEMIYDVFMTSSLPQYQKDKVGEAYLKMKEALKPLEE